MIALGGTYQNGVLKLDEEFSSENPIRVIVTFLEDANRKPEKRLTLADFSFLQSQKELEGYSGSFSDTLIEERRAES